MYYLTVTGHNSLLRYNLPVIIIILNNNGISFGLGDEAWESLAEGDRTLTYV